MISQLSQGKSLSKLRGGKEMGEMLQLGGSGDASDAPER
jgi:hypothetical protein